MNGKVIHEAAGHYMNTDLVLRARFDMTPLHKFFESQKLLALTEPMKVRRGIWYACYETEWIRGSKKTPYSPELSIKALLSVIENLEGDLLSMWNRCSERTFDIGFQEEDKPVIYRTHLCPDTVELVAKVDGAIAISIYGQHLQIGK
jgi:hypothetical protein